MGFTADLQIVGVARTVSAKELQTAATELRKGLSDIAGQVEAAETGTEDQFVPVMRSFLSDAESKVEALCQGVQVRVSLVEWPQADSERWVCVCWGRGGGGGAVCGPVSLANAPAAPKLALLRPSSASAVCHSPFPCWKGIAIAPAPRMATS